MSRIGKLAIDIPSGTQVSVSGQVIKAKGPVGERSMQLPDVLVARLQETQLQIEPNATVTETAHKNQRLNDAKGRKTMTFARALDPVARTLWGTCRANAANLVQGVTTGFTKKLELVGVGYRAQMQGKDLKLALGFSHDIIYKAPEGVSIKCEKPTEIHVSGVDKQVVGQVAAEIRNYRRPEPYKGKGVHYQGAYVRRKEGKKK